MARFLALLLPLLAACVTETPAPGAARLASLYAPPSITVSFGEDVRLPARYDEAMSIVPGSPPGSAQAFVQAWTEDALGRHLARAYSGASPSRLDLVIENIILPDQMPVLGLSGSGSFAVRFALTAEDGTMLAQTGRPFIVLPDHRGEFSLLGWFRARHWYDRNRKMALAFLAEETARVTAEALSGAAAQTGLAGRLDVMSHPVSQRQILQHE